MSEDIYWVIVTLRNDGEWRPVLSTIAKTEETCVKKYAASVYYLHNRIEAGSAKVSQCQIIIDGEHPK